MAGIESIPSLEELLGEFPKIHVNLEPKFDDSVESLIKVIRRTASKDRVCWFIFRSSVTAFPSSAA